MEEKAKYIDHTLLAPDATTEQVIKICNEAKKYGFCSVCISPCRVKLASELLKDSDVKVCTVIGFPSGAHCTEVKKFETELAIKEGANEIDMVINIGAAKEGDWGYVAKDIEAVVEGANRKAIVKVILEVCLLTDEEIVKASKCAQEAGADFVKTSTGFSTGGATVHAVKLMRKTVGPDMGVKAAGGIHTSEEMNEMIEAGANRIGASAGVKLLSGEES
ncbi:deoxyribose-phosphate aldolase [Gardnerella vaginalis]|uniref:deoxyribose-phosphate aldolase n=1 Tax=Gardnerella vaginalis TaxID=2702 RepID=UPI0003538A9E|nr:deoxyribose-phosphate aldolase [Gardnerella vaginalis]EPI56212.1 deoxyribose-phosphate aldolase [Gardnerella vaginalis JCP7275]